MLSLKSLRGDWGEEGRQGESGDRLLAGERGDVFFLMKG
jgi:hypothetical protein